LKIAKNAKCAKNNVKTRNTAKYTKFLRNTAKFELEQLFFWNLLHKIVNFSLKNKFQNYFYLLLALKTAEIGENDVKNRKIKPE